MKTFGLLLMMVMVAAVAPAAQAKPKHFYQDWRWWIGTAVIGTATVLDYSSTAHDGSRGLSESNNILLGPHPSSGRLVGVGLADFAFFTALHAGSYELVRNDPNKASQTAGLLDVPVIAGAIHGYGFASNVHVCSVSAVCK